MHPVCSVGYYWGGTVEGQLLQGNRFTATFDPKFVCAS